MERYAVAQLAEIPEITDGRCPFRPVRQHLGITSFGVNAMSAGAAGDRLINEHDEAEPESGEELYLVTSGHARFELDGEAHDAPAGTFVLAQPGVKRTAFALEAGTTVLVVGGAPTGRPYQPSGWELFVPLMGLFESGDYEQGADRGAELLADDPPYGNVYYNVACFESRVGRTELALTHLRRALELMPELTEMAREDEDLAALREEPAFAEITGGGGGG